MPIVASHPLAITAVNSISAMVAYWDSNQICRFANNAYLEWFGKSTTEIAGISLRALLGPLYEKNLPFILGALRGEKQVFERQIPVPGGGIKETIATYTPDADEQAVRGFWAHVADVTPLREREAELERTIRERDAALDERWRTSGLLPICAGCKKIRDARNDWHPVETYIAEANEVELTHGLCPDCMTRHYPGVPHT